MQSKGLRGELVDFGLGLLQICCHLFEIIFALLDSLLGCDLGLQFLLEALRLLIFLVPELPNTRGFLLDLLLGPLNL